MISRSVKSSQGDGDLLRRGVVEVVVLRHLADALKQGRRLRVKLGIDPNVTDLHLGHAVVLRKLKMFQDLGHQAVLIIGDYTALIGDPSGKDKTRPSLSTQQVKRNARSFLDQAFKILDRQKTEYHFNSQWFSKLNFQKILTLTSKVTVEHILSHDTFRQRLKKKQPFFMHELLYPLLQGYDSVAVKADVELGAAEQKFNLLAGRRLQRAYGQKEQDIVMMDYLTGVDGKEKMSKSLGNFISLRASADEMYGKLMSLPDKLIEEYFNLATDLSEAEIQVWLKRYRQGEALAVKQGLALIITKMYHGQAEAERAAENFRQVFSERQLPAKIKTLRVPEKRISLIQALIRAQFVQSKSEARRLIEQGGVRINQARVAESETMIDLTKSQILQAGKRRFIKLVSQSAKKPVN